MAEPLTPDNFRAQFQRALDVYKNAALRKKDPATAAIREAYGPVYLDFFPLDTLRGLNCDDTTKNAILTRLKDNFMQNDGDFAYAILEASREMQTAGAKFDAQYCTKLELVVADMWRKMGAQAEKNHFSSAITIDAKCTESADAIKTLGLNEALMVALAAHPSQLRAEAEVIFPELGQAMDKMAVASGELPPPEKPLTRAKNFFPQGPLLLPEHAASLIKS
jgi:hypothetical protein